MTDALLPDEALTERVPLDAKTALDQLRWHIHYRAANHFHGHPKVQVECDRENELVCEWVEEAIEATLADIARAALSRSAVPPEPAYLSPAEQRAAGESLYAIWQAGEVAPATRDQLLEAYADGRRDGERAAPIEPVGHLHSNGDFCLDRMPKPYPVSWPVPLFAAPVGDSK